MKLASLSTSLVKYTSSARRCMGEKYHHNKNPRPSNRSVCTDMERTAISSLVIYSKTWVSGHLSRAVTCLIHMRLAGGTLPGGVVYFARTHVTDGRAGTIYTLLNPLPHGCLAMNSLSNLALWMLVYNFY